jgi:hypothetical protein
MKSDHKYELTKIEGTAVLILNGYIFILTAIVNSVIRWYHHYLCHPGATCTEATIPGTMTRPTYNPSVRLVNYVNLIKKQEISMLKYL